jgi:DNA mismatch endonuclease (patch repair protein)
MARPPVAGCSKLQRRLFEMERQLRLKLPQGGFAGVSVSRSRTMSAIRGKHTKTTERALRMSLVRAGISGWQLHSELPGKPDIYFGNCGIAVFVDGCFWHGCPRCGHIPKTRSEFWRLKISRNMQRDRAAARRLRAQGIRVLRVWEHRLRTSDETQEVIANLLALLEQRADRQRASGKQSRRLRQRGESEPSRGTAVRLPA